MTESRLGRLDAMALSGLAAEPIETGRLVLEPLRVEHAEEMTGVLAAPGLYSFIGGTPPTVADLHARYERLVAGAPATSGPAGRTEAWLNWVIRERDDQRLAGTVQATVWANAGSAHTVSAPEPGGHVDVGAPPSLRAAVAWVVGSGWQGRGIATESARALVGWLWERGAKIITASIHPANVASAAVARRAGLVPTAARDEDEVVWVRSAGP